MRSEDDMTEQNNLAYVGVDETLWRATFTEFKSQALRTFQGNFFDIASGGWVDVGLADAAAGEIKEWSDVWPQQQWHIAFEILLCQQPPSIQTILPDHDDLLFFVYWNDLSKTKGSRIFARRKQKIKNTASTSAPTSSSALPLDLAWNNPRAAEIDWRSSLLLNIVLQTQYLLTVTRCPPTEIDKILDRNGTPAQKQEQSMHITRVTKRVHASPSTTAVNLDQSKSSDCAPSVSYPDICFAVDDFVEAFEDLTLEDPTECYCVVLSADVASTWRRAAGMLNSDTEENEGLDSLQHREEKKELTGQAADENEGFHRQGMKSLEMAFKESLRIETPPPHRITSPLLETGSIISVFNGYVSCQQLYKALHSSEKSPIKLLVQHAQNKGLTGKVRMNGPGGIGKAEVVVTALESGSQNENEDAKRKLAKYVLKSALAAVKMAVQVEDQQSGSEAGPDASAVKLQCALMSVHIPVEALAENILKAI